MAQHKSAKKRIRQTERRTAVNRDRLSEIRSAVKKVEVALEAGNKAEAEAALKAAAPRLQSGTGKGLVAKNTAARKISRLTKRLNAMK